MTDSASKLDPSFRASLARYLAPDIVEAMPERRAYNKATRHLNTLRVALSSYLPKYIADREELLTREYADLRLGTFMFADVSGFTALSEKLQRATGIEGAEIMTQIINDFFSTMLEILAKSDGQMLKFAGDALLTFFPVMGEDTDRADLMVASKAIRTGLRMQRSMQEKFQPIQHNMLEKLFGEHDLELKMSIGIASGYLFEALVGNASQRDHMIMGELPGMADSAEEAGVRDDVIITADLAEALHDHFTIQPAPVGEGFFQVVDDLGDDLGDFELSTIVARRKTSLGGLLDISGSIDMVEELRNLMSRVDNYARFVAAEVVNKLAIEGDRVEAQNRPAVVIFAYFQGVSALLDAWGEDELDRVTTLLNRYYSGVQQTIAAYGGALTRSDPYKVGSKLLITFGAPVAHPDDAFRAVATGLGMMRWTDQFNALLDADLPDDLRFDDGVYLQMRMGIATGQAFAGEVGWKQRREYTVMGDDVNLAARLMGKSQMGDIWISERVYHRVERFFDTEALEPMQMKGKSEPVHAFRVLSWNPSIGDVPRTSNTRFVGRDTMLLTLGFSLEQAKAKRRRLIALVGDIGMGKTRVAKQLLQDAKDRNFTVAWTTCMTMDYARITWGNILAQLLQLPTELPLPEQYAAFEEALAHFELEIFKSQLSLLVFGYEDFDPATEPDIDPRLKDDVALDDLMGELQVVVAEVVKMISDDAPTLIVLDDLHKANPYAVQILRYVVDHIKRGRLVVVVTYEGYDAFDLTANPTIMDDLSEDETFRMASEILKAPELGPNLRERLWHTAHGHPLFIEAMLQYWQERDCIAMEQGIAELVMPADKDVAQALPGIPDTLRTLLISSVDQLPPPQQTVMQAAAVIAAYDDAMDIPMLHHLGKLKSEEDINAHIDALLQRRLLVETRTGLRLHYGLTQLAVYESLTRLQRQTLHGRAADYYQRRDDAGTYFMVILQHMVKGAKMMRALELVEKAAEAAEADGDLDAAITFFDQALALFPNDRSLQTAITRLVRKAAALTEQMHGGEVPAATTNTTGKLTTDKVTAIVRAMIDEPTPPPTPTEDEPAEDDSSPDDDWVSLLKKKSGRVRRKKE
jgi:adenylate cyclase